MISADLMAVLPELFLACAAIGLLMLGVFRGNSATQLVSTLSVVTLIVTFALIALPPRPETVAFGGLLTMDGFGDFMKLLVLIGSGVSIVMAQRYIQREDMNRFEFPVLMLFATLGMMAMISANDLISLYMGLELQSLSLYVVAAFRRDNLRSSEAGLKYFVLGALSSGMLLYGSSMIYGFTGTTNFDGIAQTFAASAGNDIPIGLIVGLVFLCAGLAFKVSAVPFHMWTPDVYEGAPTPVTAFFATAPKIAAMALFIRVLMEPFGGLIDQWQQIVFFVSAASMILGAFAAINQSNIKRLMAYSSIGHIGYALIGLASGTEQGISGIVIYLTIYVFMNLGTFACILCMRQKDRMVEGIDDLKGLSKTQPMMALALAIFMFSMAGIPPLAGFFGKLYIFLAAIEAQLYILAVLGVLTSVVGAFYYLRIIKLMYFDEPAESFDRPIGREMTAVLIITGVFTLLFFVAPGPVVDSAAAAAATLFPG
ncbi:NADH-quinone oxidoreductase subunit NuoN [Pelagibius sp. Alg239-R121]|uniref:NADH-quinone oxidoreductase subunit NuoN n=1 Tax=Pelagibius sp. Alg239-R121 TaxID=2993448 RepID=UPI0024A7712B|nr:NADH-quinone oxidoreductase subunit NuoN [Pelagibius sp. Alg239-R121]